MSWLSVRTASPNCHCSELGSKCLYGCAGQPDTFEATYSFFLGRVRDRLHVCLCFSPVGPQFARRDTMQYQHLQLTNHTCIKHVIDALPS